MGDGRGGGWERWGRGEVREGSGEGGRGGGGEGGGGVILH